MLHSCTINILKIRAKEMSEFEPKLFFAILIIVLGLAFLFVSMVDSVNFLKTKKQNLNPQPTPICEIGKQWDINKGECLINSNS